MNRRNWQKCEYCVLHKYRRNVVYGKGAVPADILFIGEAPGRSEDLQGEPFIGPSGNLLRTAVKEAIPEDARIYITNVLACRPCDGKRSGNRAPRPEEILACAPRIDEIVNSTTPKVIVFLGNVAEKAYRKAYPHGLKLVHPAYLLRKGGVGCADYRAFVQGLEDAYAAAIQEPTIDFTA